MNIMGNIAPWILGRKPKFVPPAAPTAVSFQSLTANGTSGTVSTTQLTATFDVDPGLTTANFVVTGASKGVVSKVGAVYTVNINTITVEDGQSVTLDIIGVPSGFTISPLFRTVVVYREEVSITDFRVARNTVVDVSNSPAFTINTKVNRTSGPAPLGITFDVVSDSVFPGIDRPLHECAFWVDYGDATAEFLYLPLDFPAEFRNANLGQGAAGDHVYATPGNYTAKVYVWHPPTDKIGFEEIAIESIDRETFFGTNIVALSLDGDFTGAPADATRVTTISAMKSAGSGFGAVNRLYLFKRGQTTTDFYGNFSGGENEEHHYGVYGDGDEPFTFQVPAGGLTSTIKTHFDFTDAGPRTLYGVSVVGDYDPTTGAGDTWDNGLCKVWHSSNITIWRCKGKGLGVNLYVLQTNNITQDVIINDCEITDWFDFGIYAQGILPRLALTGSTIAQRVDAVSSVGDRENDNSGELVMSTAESTYTLPKLRIYGDLANLFIGIRNPTTKVVTELTGADYTFNTGTDATITVTTNNADGTHSATINVAFADGDILVYYSRRWANHGPIRTTSVFGMPYTQCFMRSTNGWSTDGRINQSCIRDSSSGTEGAWSVINQNVLIGGGQVVVVTPANLTIRQYPSDSVIESNYLYCDKNSEETILLRASGVTVRNNYSFKSDLDSDTGSGYKGFVRVEKTAPSQSDIADRPIRVYNNTVVNLTSTENGTINEEIIYFKDGSDSFFTNVIESNNLLYHPDRPTALPDYTPLDDSNYYAPLAGSAALNAGTSVDLVWDDLAGNLVGETSSVGAFDTASAPPRLYVTMQSPDIILIDIPAIKVSTYNKLEPGQSLSFMFSSDNTTTDYMDIIKLDPNASHIRVRPLSGVMEFRGSGLGDVTIVVPDINTVLLDGNPHKIDYTYTGAGGVLSLFIDSIEYFPATEVLYGSYFTFRFDKIIASGGASAASAYKVWDFTIYDTDDSVIAAFAMDSGAIDGATEAASTGTGTMTFNVDTGSWS
jgi:hypothetical protein